MLWKFSRLSLTHIFPIAKSILFFHSLLACCCYFNKLPQTGWFKTIEICFLSSGGLKSKIKVLSGLCSLQRLTETIPWLFHFHFWWFQEFLDFWIYHSNLSLHSTLPFSLLCVYGWISFSFSLMRIWVIAFRSYLNKISASSQDPYLKHIFCHIRQYSLLPCINKLIFTSSVN